MLYFSRFERYFILTFLTFALLGTGFFYYKKVMSIQDIEIIDIKKVRYLIDINTATVFEFERLSGIGPVLASDIVVYRKTNGRFRDLKELKKVKGIGDKKFGKIKDLIVISE